MASRIVEALFANPYVTAGWASDRLGVSHGGAMRAIRRLEEAGVLALVGGPRRALVWEAPAIIRAMRGTTARGIGAQTPCHAARAAATAGCRGGGCRCLRVAGNGVRGRAGVGRVWRGIAPDRRAAAPQAPPLGGRLL